MTMDVKYNADTATISIFDSDGVEIVVTLDTIMECLPDEVGRVQYLLWNIDQIRRRKSEHIETYADKIIALAAEGQRYRNTLAGLVETGKYDATVIKAYDSLIKACLNEKNTLNEFRHNTKLMAIEEGRLMKLLSDLTISNEAS